MILASFKHPKTRKLLYRYFLAEKEVPKEIRYNRKVYLLYGIHGAK